MKYLHYEIGAIQDWKEGEITMGKLLYIFEVSWDGYRKLLKISGGLGHDILQLPDEIIVKVLRKARNIEINKLIRDVRNKAKDDMQTLQ